MRDELKTERLLLRRWRESDRLPFQQMNADPRVMEFMPELLTPAASDAQFCRIQERFIRHGFGLFAAEIVETNSFIGFVGLSVPTFDAPFMPAVEIGWRLAFEHWGKGLATEGARAALNFGFAELALDQIVSFTTPANLRSRNVMEKIGMTHACATISTIRICPKAIRYASTCCIGSNARACFLLPARAPALLRRRAYTRQMPHLAASARRVLLIEMQPHAGHCKCGGEVGFADSATHRQADSRWRKA